MCEVSAEGDVLVFRAPELELAMSYLTTRAVAERVEVRRDELRVSPALPEIAAALKTLCDSEASSVLLDIKDSLLHMGWLVEGVRDITKIRKSRRTGVAGFTVVEYDKTVRRLSIFTTQTCLAEALKQLGFEMFTAKHFIEATRHVPTLAEALEIEEAISQASC
ncbi:MAG: hypothetical protein LM566_03910 [Pyrobaculum sp.]|nr:hypothetical protein [Pyrobaculum sp.]